MMEFLSVQKFAKQIGVSVSTVRLWDKQGLLKPHHRTKGNQRVYTDTQVEEYLSNSNQESVKKQED